MQILANNPKQKRSLIIAGGIFFIACAMLILLMPQIKILPTAVAAIALIACAITMFLPSSWRGDMISKSELLTTLRLQAAMFLLWIAGAAACNKLAPTTQHIISLNILLPFAMTAFIAWKIQRHLQTKTQVSAAEIITKANVTGKVIFADAALSMNSFLFLTVCFALTLLSCFYLINNLLGADTAQLNTPAALILSVTAFILALRQKLSWSLSRKVTKKQKILFIAANKLIIALIILLVINKIAHLSTTLITPQSPSFLNVRDNNHDLQLMQNAIFYSGSILIAFMRATKASSKAALSQMSILLLPAILFVGMHLINSLTIPENIAFLCGAIGGGIIFYELSIRNNFSLLTKLATTDKGIKFRHPLAKLAPLFKISFYVVAIFLFSAQHLLGILAGEFSIALCILYCFMFIMKKTKQEQAI